MSLKSVNPATGETLSTLEEHTEREVSERLDRSIHAFHRHRMSKFKERSEKLQNLSDLLKNEKPKLAQMMTLEMGKTIASAEAELEKCAFACRYYAEHGEKFLAEQRLDGPEGVNSVRYLPFGPVLAIMPWNFPFWQVIRFAAPALMAGNVGLLKHASNVPQCALALETLFKESGFDNGEFQTLLVGSKAVSKIIAHHAIKAVTLTGSEGAGQAVASEAGRHLKKTVLELGGSDPFIVMPSADSEKAVQTAVTSRTINNGQSCISAKRFIVHEEIFENFLSAFGNRMSSLKVGDPLNRNTQVGPLATETLVAQLEDQMNRARLSGGEVIVGGSRLNRPGYFFEPTIVVKDPSHSNATSEVYAEEWFGPAALVYKVSSIQQAIAIANASPYGLGSSVWTRDETEQEKFMNEIEAGQTFVNSLVASDPRIPFGGVKNSGYGRELGEVGIREFVNIKTIHRAP